MPATTRQAPPKTTPIITNGVLSTAIPVTSLTQKYIKLCIYGRNRSGKTTLAAQFRKPILFISCEPENNGGMDSVANIEGISLIKVSSHKIKGENVSGSAKVVVIARELAVSNPFRTVVLKTATSLQDIVSVELQGLSKVPEMLTWGTVPDGLYQQRASKLRETIRPLLDLTNCNVIVLAQEKDHNPVEDRGGKNKLLHTMQMGSFWAPALGATNAQWLQDASTYVIQLYEDETTQDVVTPRTDAHGKPMTPVVQKVGTDKRQRHLRLLYHPNFAAGGKWQYDENLPEFVTAPTPRELYLVLAKYIPALEA